MYSTSYIILYTTVTGIIIINNKCILILRGAMKEGGRGMDPHQ